MNRLNGENIFGEVVGRIQGMKKSESFDISEDFRNKLKTDLMRRAAVMSFEKGNEQVVSGDNFFWSNWKIIFAGVPSFALVVLVAVNLLSGPKIEQGANSNGAELMISRKMVESDIMPKSPNQTDVMLSAEQALADNSVVAFDARQVMPDDQVLQQYFLRNGIAVEQVGSQNADENTQSSFLVFNRSVLPEIKDLNEGIRKINQYWTNVANTTRLAYENNPDPLLPPKAGKNIVKNLTDTKISDGQQNAPVLTEAAVNFAMPAEVADMPIGLQQNAPALMTLSSPENSTSSFPENNSIDGKSLIKTTDWRDLVSYAADINISKAQLALEKLAVKHPEYFQEITGIKVTFGGDGKYNLTFSYSEETKVNFVIDEAGDAVLD